MVRHIKYKKDFPVPESVIHKCFDSVSTETEIHKLLISPCREILIQCIVQTLIQIIQIEKYHWSTHVHTGLYSVDVVAHLEVDESNI